ncbi:MAG: hypothetical protein ACLGSD_15190 [Acidobacteriota bacterium]
MARRSITVTLLAMVAMIGVPTLRAADKAALGSVEAGCGPPAEHFTSRPVHSNGEIEAPPPGKARVYIIDPEPVLWGGAITLAVGVDGHWAGALRGRTQFSLVLDPGEHHVCVRTERWKIPGHGAVGDSTGLLDLSLDAGQTAYLVTHVEGKMLDEYDSIDVVRIWQTNVDEGKLLVSSAALSKTWRRH